MITVNPIIPAEFLPTKSILATAWEVSTQPVFSIENYIVGRLAFNTVNKTEATFAIDESTLLSKDLFVRVQYKFNDGTVSDFTDGFYFEIPDFIGYMYTSNIRIPRVSAYLSYVNVDETTVTGNLYLKSDAFRDFNNMTEHAYTYWNLVRDDGNVVFSKTAHFLTNPEELYELDIPISYLEDEVSYTINCQYKGKNDAVSGILNYKFQSFLSNTYFKTVIMSEFTSGRVTYLKIEPKTTQFKKVSFTLEDSQGNIVIEALNQETVFPKIAVTNNLINGEIYTLKGYLTLQNGNSTPIETISSFTIKDNLLYVVNESTVVPNVVNLIGTIQTGINNALSSIQMDDGIILIGNNVTKTINKYRLVDGKLVFVGVALTIEDSENIGILYLNVMKMYNGKVVINFGYNTKYSTNNGNVFRLYTYNPADQSFTLLNQLRFPNMGNGTASSTGMITTPLNDIYFVPSYTLDENKVREALKIYKINYATFTVEKSISLPFVAKQNVSLVPTKETDKFLIIGGSENRYEVDGQMTWKRENQTVYTLNSSNDTILPFGLELFDEDTGLYVIDPYFYSLQGYVRADGKVVLFNSSVDGPKMKIQDLFLLDTTTKAIQHIQIDVPDEDVYKSTIRLNNGGFLRISSTYTGTDKVLLYPATSTNGSAPGSEVITGKLVIHVGETKYLTEINFDKIVIEGDSPTNTGTLILLVAGKEFVYNYGTIILGRTQTLTAEEKGKYSQIVVVNNSTVRVTDAL